MESEANIELYFFKLKLSKHSYILKIEILLLKNSDFIKIPKKCLNGI